MDWKRAYLLLPCVGALSALPLAAQASAVGLFSNIHESAYNSTTHRAVGSGYFSSNSTGALITHSASTPAPMGGGTLNFAASGAADYGLLKGSAWASITGASGVSTTGDAASVGGNSGFNDLWKIGGGTGTGTLNLKFHVDGTYDSSGAATASANLTLVNFNDGSEPKSSVNMPGTAGVISQDITFSTGFTFGTALHFGVELAPDVTISDFGINGTYAFLDLSDTAVMESIVVKDSLGNVVPFSLTTASGAALFSRLATGTGTPPKIPVPEPSSIALFGAGLLGLLGLAARSPLRRRRSDAA